MEFTKKQGSYLLFFLTISFLFIIIFVMTNHIKWFDLPLTLSIQSLESKPLTEIMLLFSLIGSAKLVIPIAVVFFLVFLFIFKYRYELILFVTAIAGSSLLNVLLKNVFQRERPISHRLAEATGYSFPSGHSMAAFTLYVTLAFLITMYVKKRSTKLAVIVIAVIMILGIGISRIYLGVHYPSDVLGGYLTSALWLYILVYLYRKFIKKIASK